MAAKQFIHRAQRDKENPYRMIARSAMEDPNLSYAAAGLLAYILVKPDTWRVMIEDLAKAKRKDKRNGMDCVYKLLKELITEGYITRRRGRGRRGQIGQTSYEVHETPFVKSQPPHRELPDVDLPDVDLPDVDLPDVETPEYIPIYTNKEEEVKKNSSGQIPLLPTDPPAGPATEKEVPFLLTEEKEQPPPATTTAATQWATLLTELAREMPSASFDTWVRNTTPVSATNDHWTIGTPNASGREWLNARLRVKVQKSLSCMLGHKVNVTFATMAQEQAA